MSFKGKAGARERTKRSGGTGVLGGVTKSRQSGPIGPWKRKGGFDKEGESNQQTKGEDGSNQEILWCCRAVVELCESEI